MFSRSEKRHDNTHDRDAHPQVDQETNIVACRFPYFWSRLSPDKLGKRAGTLVIRRSITD